MSRYTSLVTALGVAGSLVGHAVATRLPQAKLRRLFGVFLVVMGLYILARSLPSVLQL